MKDLLGKSVWCLTDFSCIRINPKGMQLNINHHLGYASLRSLPPNMTRRVCKKAIPREQQDQANRL
jgi:hypothetical protein